MKKTIALISLFVLLCGKLSAIQTQKTENSFTKNPIQTEVGNQVHNDTVMNQTGEKTTYIAQTTESKQSDNEAFSLFSKDGRHRGLDFSVEAGYHIATKGSGGSVSAEIGLGKRFNKNFYWGIGTGALIPTNGGDVSIPITSDFKVYFPLRTSNLTPGGILRIGYVINTADDVTIGTGKYATTVESPDYIMLQIMPTLDIRLSKRVDFNLGLGYTHFFPTKGSGSNGAFSIRTGFSFHKSPIGKPKVPTRDRGLQLTLEGGMVNFGGDDYNGATGAFAVTYKLNPHLSVGLGAGADIEVEAFVPEAVNSLRIRNDNNVFKSTYDIDLSFSTIKIFARGVYRLTDKRFSPFAACDAGIRLYQFDNDMSFYGDPEDDDNSSIEYVLGKPSKVGVFVSPAIGLSIRTTNNSYIELKAGYNLAPSISGKKGEKEYETSNFKFNHIASSKSVKMSAPFVSLGFTHTFKWGENW